MKNLTVLRQRKGYTRKQMAEFLHVTIQAYSRYEQGIREPSLMTLKKIATILEVPISLLFDEPELKPNYEISIDKGKNGPVVRIVNSEPRLTHVNKIILEKYFTLILSEIDLDDDIASQIEEISKRQNIDLKEYKE